MKVVYDIEVIHDLFLLCAKNYITKEEYVFEMSSRKNELYDLVKFINNNQLTLIGFNSIGYDNIITNCLIKNYNRYKSLDSLKITKELRQISDWIIEDGKLEKAVNYKKYSKYKYDQPFESIDLFLYWSKMLRQSKKLSLKSLAIWLNHPIIQEFNNSLEIDEMIKYCKNDVAITESLLNHLLPDVKLRYEAKKVYGFNCLSWDGVKLGLNVLLKRYCDRTGKDIEEVKKLRTHRSNINIGNIILPFIEFKPNNETYFIQYLKRGGKKKPVKCFKSFYPLLQELKSMTVTNTDQIDFRVYYNNVVYDIKSGGLHSYHNSSIVIPKDDEIYLDVDVSSYYPTFGGEWNFVPKHLGLEFAEELRASKNERIELKAKGLGKSNQANLLKLGMNGGFYGNTNNNYTPMLDLQCMLSITLNGQLLLLMLCEQCELEGIKVDMCNTDGVTFIIPNSKLDIFNKICSNWEKLTKMELERVKYLKVIRKSINDYLAIYEEKGVIKTKEKGEFNTKPEIGNSTDFLIIPKAIKEYYLNSTSIEQFITNHTNIYDFCASQKADHSYQVWWNGEKQQRLNRYYVSKKGAYLYKEKDGDMSHMLKESPVLLLNNYEEKPIKEFYINYQYYINKVKSIINDLNNNYQLSIIETENQLNLF